MKTADNGQSISIFNPKKNEISRQNVKSLFIKQRKSARKIKNKKSTVMNNNN